MIARRYLLSAICYLLVAGCASWPRAYGVAPCCIATKPHVIKQPVWWHVLDVAVLEPLEFPLRLGRPLRAWAGSPVRALNLSSGRVADSAFFTNRDIASTPPEQIRWGPSTPEDVPRPPVTITKSKMEGKTAGFFVTDANGQRFLLKLDPVAAPELLSGAEVVTSKLLHALGYHVPSYEIARLSWDDVRIAPGAAWKGPLGLEQPFTESHLHQLLDERLSQGTFRASASKILEGTVLGPARFKRFRDCAEIRALRLAFAWVNNIDTKDQQTLLVWDGTKTVGYLLDFGTSLGADAGRGGPKHPCAGWTSVVDLRQAVVKLLTFGMRHPTCDATREPFSAAIGLFSPQADPQRWKPYVPNIAFEAMTEDDADWMARRMSQLSDARIAAAVSAGQYSHPADAAYLTQTLIQRRDAIVRRYQDD
ncbi:MAG: hypothetical protein HY737_05225 [Candidatus Omnitrophica bacterium]|nr:hypothetical protein [Candidatus Omnitrophota bacterium]